MLDDHAQSPIKSKLADARARLGKSPLAEKMSVAALALSCARLEA